MKIGLHQSARLEQRLMQSPQMIQAMQILQLGALELEGRIEQELLENPVLEWQEAAAPEAPAAPQTEPGGEDFADPAGERGDMFDAVESMEWDFGDGHQGAPPPSPQGATRTRSTRPCRTPRAGPSTWRKSWRRNGSTWI
ncbi:MAG: hypothetical protein R3F17_13920 [Planctomycetota bacterium]